MGLKVATTTTSLHWPQPFVSHSPYSHYAISSPSSKRRGAASTTTTEGAIVCRFVQKVGRRSTLFGTQPSSIKLYRTRSCEHPKSRWQTLRRACSASFDAFSDEEFLKKIQELALKFQSFEDEDDNEKNSNGAILDAGTLLATGFDDNAQREGNTAQNTFRSTKLEPIEPLDWPTGDEIIPASIQRKANSVELPLSLRIIKRKKQWQEGFREAGECAYCSVKKAFCSMVFIIRELYTYTMQMREMLFYEDLQDIMVRVQKEIHASFAWLFERVFSHTPTLMVYVMILLANYSVYSVANNTALAFAATSTQTLLATTESVSVVEDQSSRKPKFDSSVIKTFTVSSSSSNGKTTSIDGNNGGGRKYRPVASGSDGDGLSDGSISSNYHRTILHDGTTSSVGQEESVSDQVGREEELRLWNSVVEEASRMQALAHEMKQRFVSPVDVKIEEDGYEDYFRTELLYQTALAQEPDNPLLLANFAQFLYLVSHDYDRAEDFFKKAVDVEPKDAEALSKYGNFLWQVRKDLWAAEETYLEAISAEPSNSYYAANYAHFLWSTGGEDTCFPLSSPDSNTDEL